MLVLELDRYVYQPVLMRLMVVVSMFVAAVLIMVMCLFIVHRYPLNPVKTGTKQSILANYAKCSKKCGYIRNLSNTLFCF